MYGTRLPGHFHCRSCSKYSRPFLKSCIPSTDNVSEWVKTHTMFSHCLWHSFRHLLVLWEDLVKRYEITILLCYFLK